jgi:hypothetical protein
MAGKKLTNYCRPKGDAMLQYAESMVKLVKMQYYEQICPNNNNNNNNNKA